MQYTDNFNLNKPEGSDVYDIANENENMDTIDEALAKAFSTDDAASTELANADYLPFYDASASAKKKMSLSTLRKDVRARIAESVSNDVMETIGGTALNSYSVGQYFLGNDGYYYVATSAITANSSTISTGVSGNCSKTSIAAGMNSLTSQISNLANHGWIDVGFVTFKYYTSSQLKADMSEMTPSQIPVPQGYSIRILAVTNVFPNNEFGLKCKTFLSSGDNSLRLTGEGFVSTDQLTVQVFYQIYKI